MAYSILEIKADTESAFHGQSINKIRNFYGALNRAARRCVSDTDFAETKRVVPLFSPLYASIYDYPCPSDLKGDRIVDIRKQTGRRWYGGWTGWDGDYNQTYSSAFNHSLPSLAGIISSIRWNGGLKTLRIATGYQTATVLTDATATTGWTAGGTASNLILDTQNFYEGSSSLRFDLATGTGYIEISTLTAVDLTNILNIGSLFNLVYLPTVALTSVNLRWGSDVSNYWTATATADHASNVYQLGWNTSEFPWPATKVGNPDVTHIRYLRVTFVVSTPVYGMRMDSVTAQLGRIYEAEYYSKCLFRDGSTGNFKEKVTLDSDILNLDTDSYEVFLSCFLWILGQQLQGLDASMADGNYNQQAYLDNLKRYQSTHKSEVSLPIVPYYNLPSGRRSIARRWYS